MVQDINKDINKLLETVRKGVFISASVFSFFVTLLSALVIHWEYLAFAAMGIATGLVTLATLPTMLFVSMNRKGALTSMIIVEVAWIWFLVVLWLVTAGFAASRVPSDEYREVQAVTAFAFFTWFILLVYNLTVIFLTVRHQSRGHSGIWTGYVNEINYAAPPPESRTYRGGIPQDAKGEQYPPTNNTGYNATLAATPHGPQQQQTQTSPYPQV